MSTPIKVLIIDDSSVVRRMAFKALNSDPEISVVGSAENPYIARDRILELKPDVLTLDIEMPKMDGLTFLRIIMEKHPMPVVMMSSLTQKGSLAAIRALQAGAIEVIAKPSGSDSMVTLKDTLINAVKAAAMSNRKRLYPQSKNSTPTPVPSSTSSFNNRKLLLLGASTGGTEALKEVLTRLPQNIPGIGIVQHIPPYFSKAFADRMNTLCPFEVREAKNNDIVKPGLALVAPGDYHMTFHWNGSNYQVHLDQSHRVWHQRPAVDNLFLSIRPEFCRSTASALLTGMGRDGAEGLLHLKKNGSKTFAQNEETCVVFGMPRAAQELEAAQRMLPLEQIPRYLMQAIT